MLHAEKRNSRSGFLSSFADYRAKSSDYRVSRSRTSLQREIKARASPPAAPSPRDISRGLNIGNEALDSSEANLLELTNKDGRRSPNTLDANSRRPWRIFQCSLFIACAWPMPLFRSQKSLSLLLRFDLSHISFSLSLPLPFLSPFPFLSPIAPSLFLFPQSHPLSLSLAHSTIILMKIWWDIISPTDCSHYRTMPAGCAGISGNARSTFDLNSGRFLQCRFTRRRLFQSAGLRPSALRFSIDGPWRSTSTCAQLGFPLSIPRRVSDFLRAVKVSEREREREDGERRKEREREEGVRNSRNKMESPVLCRARLQVFLFGSLFVLLTPQSSWLEGVRQTQFHTLPRVSGGREKVRLASFRKRIRTMMTDTTVSIWGNFPFA